MGRRRWSRGGHKDTSHKPITEALSTAGVPWVEVNAGRWCAKWEEPRQSGVADLFAFPGEGRVVGLEVKTPGGKGSNREKKAREERQAAFRSMCRAQGVACYEVETALEALAACEVSVVAARRGLVAAGAVGANGASYSDMQRWLEEARARLQAQVELEQAGHTAPIQPAYTPGTEPLCVCGHQVHTGSCGMGTKGRVAGRAVTVDVCSCPKYRPATARRRLTLEEAYAAGVPRPKAAAKPRRKRPPKLHRPPDTRPPCSSDPKHGPAFDRDKCSSCIYKEVMGP